VRVSCMLPLLWQTRTYFRDRGECANTVQIWVAIPIVSRKTSGAIWNLDPQPPRRNASASPCQGEAIKNHRAGY